MSKEWFATWFDTHYYHLLYRHRNEVEARRFIDALLHFLSPAPGSSFVDIACGKGRHSKYLHSKGYITTGLDLSENSIRFAQENSKGDEGIAFHQHDIRQPFPVSDQDFGVNFFTSFGYFESDEEHEQALKNIADCLKVGGRFVIDYLNVSEVVSHMKEQEMKEVDGVEFCIERKLMNNSIVKQIEVKDAGHEAKFEERVRAFTKEDLCNMIADQGFELVEVFGDYELNPYHPQSPRVLIIAQKQA